jgi:tetratricopeptide (TPR) repeat protein
MNGDAAPQAQAYYTAGNFRQCHQVALQGLMERPDDVSLLRLAGGAALELDLDDAVTYLQRAAQLSPDDADAWRSLGIALANEGRTQEAVAAFQRAVDLNPDSHDALSDLGHALYIIGQEQEAIALLVRAAEREPGNISTLRGLTEMYLETDRLPLALVTARKIVHWQPDDVLATLDIADLSLTLGNLDDAVDAYRRLRQIDTEPLHEVYACHGTIQAEMQREQWRRALDLAVDATRVARDDLTTQLLAFIIVQVFGASGHPTLTRAELDAALIAEHAEHRGLHSQALVP